MKKTKRQLDQEIEEVLRKRGRGHKGRHVAHHALHWKGSEIQSLLFDKQWTVPEAKRWARDHGYRSAKAHVTDDYIRLRQFEPVPGTEHRTITFGQGIKAIVEGVKA